MINNNILKIASNDNSPENVKVLTNITKDSYTFADLNNTFIIFKSINNILYLVYSNINKSIVLFDLNNLKLISEIKPYNNENIIGFRHYLDKIEKRDLIMGIYLENNIRLFDAIDFKCILNIPHIYNKGYLFSSCFLNQDNNNYIITSNCNWIGNSENIKIFDFNGNKIKEINSSFDKTVNIDTYYDKVKSKNYIIAGNYYYSKSYDYIKNELYQKNCDNENGSHGINIINDSEEIIQLIDSCIDGNIRIFNFHSGLLLKKILICNNILFAICLWSNDYLFVGCDDNTIKLVDLKNELIIKSLIGHENRIISIKKLNLFKYGECLISQGWKSDQIKLWIKIN